MNDIQRYNALVSATKILDEVQFAVWNEEATSPAWRVLIDARDYLRRQAEDLFMEDAQAAKKLRR